MRILHIFLLGLAVGGATSAVLASDPRNAGYEFQYSLYPPKGFSVKKSKAVLRADPKQPKAVPLLGADGKFTELGQWYYAMGSDPKSFEKWWLGYWNDTNNWKQSKSPVYDGPGALNQGHRIIAWLGMFKNLVQGDKEIDAEVKQALMNDAWKRAVEKIIGDTIDERGWLKSGQNEAAMAQIFHFLRTKFGAMGLSIPNIYTLDRAQNLMCTVLTEPWVICEEDKYLAPPGLDYLEEMGKQHGGTTGDIRIVKDGKVLFAGGLFIGWKDKPSLHGTWDALSIINSLFKYYPDPDPGSSKSIFYKWNRRPEEKKQIGKKTIILCSRRLWLDWQENKGKTWCWVHNGKPTDDYTGPSDVPFLPAYDGYGDNQLGWAKQCWEEMFGDPQRNTNDGVQALLAIAHGRIHRNLKTPVGQQVPGRYDFDPEVQKKRLEEDAQKLKATPPKLADEEPRLDPAKSNKVSE
ncbi:MAG: hypothetical protein NTY02_05510 [Acidobacteria bacterium]|nr:hypothetical protein [Acidobacteriota bacterium]